MARPKYLWYDYVKKSILYSLGGCEGQAQSEKQKEKFDSALEKVLARTKGQYRGEERLEFINLVYRRQRFRGYHRDCDSCWYPLRVPAQPHNSRCPGDGAVRAERVQTVGGKGLQMHRSAHSQNATIA